MVWIHYSEETIEKLLDDDACIKQHFHFKPFGLWLSKDSEWLEWMKSEMPEWIEEVNYIYKISIKKNTNLLKISSFEDVVKLHNKYMVKANFVNPPEIWNEEIFEPYLYFINWKKVCQDYDGIIFTNYQKIQEKIRKISKDNKQYRTEYAWYHTLDINSACIFRPSKVISKFELIYKN